MNKIKCIILAFVLVACGTSYDQTIEIESMGNQMKYNVPVITAKPNTKIKIIFTNNASMEVMKHNIVILKNKNVIDEVGKAALSAPNYLPKNKNILAASAMVGPSESTELIFDVPTEKGEYPFICTFPGHYQVMQGKIVVN